MERLVNYEQLAEILGLSANTLRVWVSARKIPFTKIGGAVRFTSEQVESIVNRGKQESLIDR